MTNNKSQTPATVLTVREALALASGTTKVSAAQYGRITATIGTMPMVEALVAYAVATRGISSYADGAASLTALARDTLREGQRVEARRSALSKLSTAVAQCKAAGVDLTPETFEAVRLAGDSTKEGRDMLKRAVEAAAANKDRAAALTDLLAACTKARESKAAARKASDAAKGEAAATAAADRKATDVKGESKSAPLTWAQTLAMLAATADAEAAALDADALDVARGMAATIVAALDDASATVAAALATARNARRK